MIRCHDYSQVIRSYWRLGYCVAEKKLVLLLEIMIDYIKKLIKYLILHYSNFFILI